MDIAFLRNHPLTLGLKAEQLQHLGTLVEPVELARGDEILGEGIPAKGLFICREGRLRVTQKTERGPRTLAELEGPTVVGEVELISGSPSAATVAAATSAQGALLTVDAFASLVEAGDPVVAKLLRNIARVLARRVVAMNQRVAAVVAPAKAAELASIEGDVRHSWAG